MSFNSYENSDHPVDLIKVAVTVLLWGILGLLIAGWYHSVDKRYAYDIKPLTNKIPISEREANIGKQPDYQIGPIVVEEDGEVYELTTRTYIPLHYWTFVEVEVLDYQEEYLYSLGQELWHETGRDSDGQWTESRQQFDTKITFKYPGYYYLNFIVDSKRNRNPDSLHVELVKRQGSSIPHYWLGIFCIIIAFVIFEIHSKRAKKILFKRTNSKKSVVNTSIGIAGLYLIMVPYASNGYGYMGYGDYHAEPSWWYWNDTNYYYEKNVRSGSVSGAGTRGGGPGQGK